MPSLGTAGQCSAHRAGPRVQCGSFSPQHTIDGWRVEYPDQFARRCQVCLIVSVSSSSLQGLRRTRNTLLINLFCLTCADSDHAIYGGPPAKLEHISADTITDENGESFFTLSELELNVIIREASHPLKTIPGMTAVVDILAGQNSVLNHLQKPVLRAMEKALRER